MSWKQTPTTQQFTAFERMFNHFNGALFHNRLKAPLLNFSRKAKAEGFFAPDRWGRAETKTHEISINPTVISRMTALQIAQTLVHEMVHLWQQDFGTPSRSGYHNTEWASKMDEVGLTPSSTGKPGGARVGQRMSDFVTDGGAFARAFESMPRDCHLPLACFETKKARVLAAKKLKSSYVCACAKVWGRPGLHLNCWDCGRELVAA